MDNESASQLAVTYLPTDRLRPHPNNSRLHSNQQIKQIAASIEAFGFLNAVLITRDNVVVAGHGRVEAAKRLGMKIVPTVRLENLTDDQIRSYMLADNRIAERAGWDRSILTIELQHLLTVDTELDVTLTGFTVPEIDLLIQEAQDKKQDKDDDFVVDQTSQPITQLGDLWKLGKHLILCGNALDSGCFHTLMARRQANLVFVDPPYNVTIDGHASGNGSVHHREFNMAVGEMNEAEFVSFLTTVLRLLSRYSTPDSIHFVCMDWRHVSEITSAGKHIYDSLLNICIWVKNNGGLGSFYRSRHELVFVFRNGRGRHRNNIQLGKFGRNRTNVWEYPNAKTLSQQGEEGNLLALHPTVKPVALVADAILDCSARGEIVLDSFLGSGTTLIAAERVGRICFGIELDPLYVDVAIRRWQRHTGDRAVHAPTGRIFDEVSNTVEANGGQ